MEHTLGFFSIFLIGLFSSFGHCIGMCGGFVMTYSLKIHTAGTPSSFWQRFYPHLLYNSGRILTYTFLGFFFGLLGETLKVILQVAHFQGTLEMVAGSIMVLMGLDLGGWFPLSKGGYLPGFHWFISGIQRLIQRVNRRNTFQLGLALGFIPCGLVYAAGASAAASGSAIKGALLMLTFGLGTIPALILVALSTQWFSTTLRQRFLKVATVLVIILGLFTIYRGYLILSNPQKLQQHQQHNHMAM